MMPRQVSIKSLTSFYYQKPLSSGITRVFHLNNQYLFDQDIQEVGNVGAAHIHGFCNFLGNHGHSVSSVFEIKSIRVLGKQELNQPLLGGNAILPCE